MLNHLCRACQRSDLYLNLIRREWQCGFLWRALLEENMVFPSIKEKWKEPLQEPFVESVGLVRKGYWHFIQLKHSSYPFLICSPNRDPGQSLIGYGVLGKTWPAFPAIQRLVSILTWKNLNNRKICVGALSVGEDGLAWQAVSQMTIPCSRNSNAGGLLQTRGVVSSWTHKSPCISQY